MADHRMNERAGRETKSEHGRSRLREDAQGVQLRPLSLSRPTVRTRNQLLFSATGAYAPLSRTRC